MKFKFRAKLLQGSAPSTPPPAFVRPEVKDMLTAQPSLISWYGDDFQGKPTASKGRKDIPEEFWFFDKDKFTCAHWTLPLGSKVKMTYGGKSVVMMITDRGPHPRLKRDFDLSERAAKYLGYTENGMARVKVQGVPKSTPMGPC
jgi:rare lipoprotein A